MKRKVFAGSAVAAALLFQLTAVSFPAYAAEYDAVQKEEFVSSFNVNNVGDNTYNSAVLIDNVLVA